MREAESRPPWTAPGEAVAFIQLPALPVTPRWARRHAKAVLGAWLVPSDVTETALLLVSELVTNSVAALTRHARQEPAAGLIEQTLRRQPERIVIEVSDPDPDPPVVADAGLEAENGRGLILVQALSKEWSYFFPPSGGKTTYFVLPITEDPAPADGRTR